MAFHSNNYLFAKGRRPEEGVAAYPMLEQTVTRQEYLHSSISPIDLLLQEQNERSSPNYSLPLSTVGPEYVITASHVIRVSHSPNLRPHSPWGGRLPCFFVSWEALVFCFPLGYGWGHGTIVLPGARCYLLWDFFFVEKPLNILLSIKTMQRSMRRSPTPSSFRFLLPPSINTSISFSYSVSFQSSSTWVCVL